MPKNNPRRGDTIEDDFFARQCKSIFGVIGSPAERVMFILARYFFTFVLPFTTQMYHYNDYVGAAKILFFVFAWFGVFLLYCIVLDIYIIVKRIKNHKNAREKN